MMTATIRRDRIRGILFMEVRTKGDRYASNSR